MTNPQNRFQPNHLITVISRTFKINQPKRTFIFQWLTHQYAILSKWAGASPISSFNETCQFIIIVKSKVTHGDRQTAWTAEADLWSPVTPLFKGEEAEVPSYWHTCSKFNSSYVAPAIHITQKNQAFGASSSCAHWPCIEDAHKPQKALSGHLLFTLHLILNCP